MIGASRERLKAPQCENRELKRANKILRKASRRFSPRWSSTAEGKQVYHFVSELVNIPAQAEHDRAIELSILSIALLRKLS